MTRPPYENPHTDPVLPRYIEPVVHLLALCLLPLSHAVGQDADPMFPLTPQLWQHDLEQWEQHVRPSEQELLYTGIQWHSSFAAGLRAAADARRPLLLWAMNGHPLGCT